VPVARVTGRFGGTEGIGANPGARERERVSYLPRPGSVQVVRIPSRVKTLCETVRRAIVIAPGTTRSRLFGGECPGTVRSIREEFFSLACRWCKFRNL
jgi:hypothetical protein